MSSLAIYAAPFDNSSNDTNEESIVDKKKNAHNRTQKRLPKESYNSEKVNSVLQTLHNNQETEQDNMMGDYFNPPPKPQSSGVQKTISTENMQTISNTNGSQPSPNYDNSNNLDLNNFNDNYGDNKTAEKYYKKMIPNYNSFTQETNTNNRQYYQSGPPQEPTTSNDILMQKLNYMIHLLEEQQDEKTNNVTEEVVLYSFLGIFIIFVCDSFARAGKYVR
jgi:hypothetical protein